MLPVSDNDENPFIDQGGAGYVFIVHTVIISVSCWPILQQPLCRVSDLYIQWQEIYVLMTLCSLDNDEHNVTPKKASFGKRYAPNDLNAPSTYVIGHEQGIQWYRWCYVSVLLVWWYSISLTYNSYQDPDPVKLDLVPPSGNKYILFIMFTHFTTIDTLPSLGTACSWMWRTWTYSCLPHMQTCGLWGMLLLPLYLDAFMNTDTDPTVLSMSLNTAASRPVRSLRVSMPVKSTFILCQWFYHDLFCTPCWFKSQQSQEDSHLWLQRWLACEWCSCISYKLLFILHWHAKACHQLPGSAHHPCHIWLGGVQQPDHPLCWWWGQKVNQSDCSGHRVWPCLGILLHCAGCQGHAAVLHREQPVCCLLNIPTI